MYQISVRCQVICRDLFSQGKILVGPRGRGIIGGGGRLIDITIRTREGMIKYVQKKESCLTNAILCYIVE